MEPDSQLHFANELQAYRADLASLLEEIHERAIPLTDLELRLLKEVTSLRLEFIENQLRRDAQRRIHRGFAYNIFSIAPARFRQWLMRIRGLARPKIGRLRHYPPRPLLIPAAYVKAGPPIPTPTISIVTPSYAQGRFIERTLYSVLTQNYPALEYFVQDGGSTDETVEILRRYQGQLAGWTSEPDDGQADAINRAFAHTTGDIMAWINADDMLLPGALSYVARYFETHPAADVVYGNRILIDDTDGQIGLWVLPKHDDHVLTLVDYVPQETLFWRRSIWDAAGGGLDPTFGYALDWDLLLRFREAGATIVRLPRFLGAFRVHPDQKTSAEDVLGATECARLRTRVHGRPVTTEEIVAELRPYMRRHVFAHLWQILVARLPRRRTPLQTAPSAPAPQVLALSLFDDSTHESPQPVLQFSDTEATT